MVTDRHIFEDSTLTDSATFTKDAATDGCMLPYSRSIENDRGINCAVRIDRDGITEAGSSEFAVDRAVLSGNEVPVLFIEEFLTDVKVATNTSNINPIPRKLVAVEAPSVLYNLGKNFFFHGNESSWLNVI